MRFSDLGLRYWVSRYSSWLDAIAPIEWFSSKMSNGDNQDSVASDLVDDPVRKSFCSASASLFGKPGPGSRVPQYPIDRIGDLPSEFITEIQLLLVVIFDLLLQFNLRWFQEVIVFHLFFLGFRRRKTSLPGIDFKKPFS